MVQSTQSKLVDECDENVLYIETELLEGHIRNTKIYIY